MLIFQSERPLIYYQNFRYNILDETSSENINPQGNDYKLVPYAKNIKY